LINVCYNHITNLFANHPEMKLVKCLGFILSFQIAIVIMASCNTHHSSNNDWRFYGGNPGGDRYSTLTQVNRNNVKELKLAWTYDTGENNDTTKRGKLVEVQPIVVNGIFYGVTTGSKLFAIDGATGKEIWKFDPFEGEQKRIYQLTRGVTYWENGKDKRIFYGVGSLLYAIDAVTGKPINSFGKAEQQVCIRDWVKVRLWGEISKSSQLT